MSKSHCAPRSRTPSRSDRRARRRRGRRTARRPTSARSSSRPARPSGRRSSPSSGMKPTSNSGSVDAEIVDQLGAGRMASARRGPRPASRTGGGASTRSPSSRSPLYPSRIAVSGSLSGEVSSAANASASSEQRPAVVAVEAQHVAAAAGRAPSRRAPSARPMERYSIEVTTPKFPPPPLSAQNSRMLVGAGGDEGAVGGDEVHREDVVAGEAVLPHQPAQAAAERQAADAAGDGPASRRGRAPGSRGRARPRSGRPGPEPSVRSGRCGRP